MIQIAVCDDDFQVCSQLENYIRRWKEGHRLEVKIFNTGKEFEEALEERHYDLISLDIVMRDRNGIELGRFTREELGGDTGTIVYMLAYGDEYALDLFRFQSFHFVERPIRPEDLQNISYKTCGKIEGDAGIFELKSSRTVYRIPSKDILYFEGDNRWVKIVTAGHTYHCYSVLENLFSKINMGQADSIRLHKSYAVNLRCMATFSVHMMTLLNGSESTVSAPFKESALRQYEGYISKTGMGRGDTSGEQMQGEKQMHRSKVGARRFSLQTPAFYRRLEASLRGFIDSFNDSYGLVHAKLADVK